jgi:glutathione S-transferase
MIVFTNDTTPFGRKIRVVAMEKGLEQRIEFRQVDPWNDTGTLTAHNPLSKVPTLQRPDGPALFDSRNIAEYLDSLAPAPPLLPAAGEARWAVQRYHALADGICDAALSAVVENRRPESERSANWVRRQRAAIVRGLAALEAESEQLGQAPDLGTLATAVALGYLDLRHADLAWRETHPRLAAWHAQFAQRPSIRATTP